MNCDKLTCGNTATKKLSIKILAAIGDDPSIASVDLKVCEEHANAEETLTIMKVFAPQIEKQFKGMGLAKPDWDRSTIEWVDLECT